MDEISGGLKDISLPGQAVEPDRQLTGRAGLNRLQIKGWQDWQNVKSDALSRDGVAQYSICETHIRQLGDDVGGGQLPALDCACGIEVGDARSSASLSEKINATNLSFRTPSGVRNLQFRRNA